MIDTVAVQIGLAVFTAIIASCGLMIALGGWRLNTRTQVASQITDVVLRAFNDSEFRDKKPVEFRDKKLVEVLGKDPLTPRTGKQKVIWAIYDGRLTLSEWLESSVVDGSPEKHLASHLANNVTELGSKCFIGGVRPSTIVTLNGPVIVEEWILVTKHVEELRSITKTAPVSPELEGLHYERASGEWIALIAALWLHRNWHHRSLNLLFRDEFTIEKAEERLRLLSRAPGKRIAFTTRLEIYEMTGVFV